MQSNWSLSKIFWKQNRNQLEGNKMRDGQQMVILNYVTGIRIEKMFWWFPRTLVGCEGGVESDSL